MAPAHRQLKSRSQLLVLRHGPRLQVRSILPADKHSDEKLGATVYTRNFHTTAEKLSTDIVVFTLTPNIIPCGLIFLST